MTAEFPYVVDDDRGETWQLMLGDSCERLAEIGDRSIDLCVYSPPFASLFTYSPSERDLGNSASREEFIAHYRYIVDHLLRVMRPGRIVAVHCQQIATQKGRDGAIGMTDFRGQLIQTHVDAGMIYHGEITVDKDPQVQAVRTKAVGLLFVTLKRDSAMTRPAFADYVLLFRTPGDNQTPILAEVDNDTWIEWARPVWYGIRETETLNTMVAKDNADERHICPLQLPLIERIVRLWSNRGEVVLSPFAGIGSEGYKAVKLGRRYIGVELKPSYWRVACDNLRTAEYEAGLPTLFDDMAEERL